MTALHDIDRLAEAAADIVSAAGQVIMAVYETPFETRSKADASPVTDADLAAEAIILPLLEQLLPGVPVVAEEQVSRFGAPARVPPAFWLVDPLDGTREFTARNGEFTVNIALVESGRPVMGVVYAPATGTLHLGGRTARRADLAPGERFDAGMARPIRTRARPARLTAVASRSHCDRATLDWLASHGVSECVHVGSALKFGTVAEGRADVYPRFTATSEWDTAAGQAVVTAAGGVVLTPDGLSLAYGKPGFVNGPFVVWGQAPDADQGATTA